MVGNACHRAARYLLLSIGMIVGITTSLHAQHTRIYACAIANDSAGAFMGASSNGSGLYQSDDTGKTWKHLGWSNIKCYSMDMVQSSNGRILYLATGLGVLRSTDFGETWKQLTDWRVSEVMDVAVNQKNPKEIYIATAHGPWKTKDGGRSWIPIGEGMRTPYCSRVKFDSTYTRLFLVSEDGLYYRNTKESKWTIVLDGPVRDVLTGTGLKDVFVASQKYGVVYFPDVTDKSIEIRSGIEDSAWCITKSGEGFSAISGGPHGIHSYGGIQRYDHHEYKNVASLFHWNNTLLIGTLGDGIWLEPAHIQVLPHLQIWTMKLAQLEE